MAQTINGSTAYIAGQAQTVDPDESPDRADKGYTGVSPDYQNAVDHTYAPQGDEDLVPEQVAFGYVEPSKEQVAANKAQAKADEAQAKADAAAADEAAKAEAERIEAARVAAEAPPVTPVTTSTTPVAPEAPSTDKK